MKTTDFNINNYVHVKLREPGRKVLESRHKDLNKRVNGALGLYKPPPEDSEGWSKWQVHDLMNTFGEAMGLSCDPPFETTIRFEL